MTSVITEANVPVETSSGNPGSSFRTAAPKCVKMSGTKMRTDGSRRPDPNDSAKSPAQLSHRLSNMKILSRES